MRMSSRDVVVCAIGLLVTTGCGGGGSHLDPPATDLTGTWSVQETADGNCAGISYPQQSAYTATLAQTGNSVIMSTAANGSSSGTISGSHVSWNGSRPQESGTTSYSFSGTVDAAGNTISGSATWTWSGAGTSCGGTAVVSLTRTSASGPNPGSSTIDAPTVTATPGYSQVTITWPPVTGATGYYIYRSTSPSVTTSDLVLDIVDSGSPVDIPMGWLTNGTTYYIAAVSLDASGHESVMSSVVSATPSSASPRPATPTLLSAVPGPGTVTISHSAVSGATRYRVAWSTSNTLTTYASLQNASYYYAFDANPVTIKAGIVSGTTYYFVVTAWNVDGESEPSSSLAATPQ
jgi:hypothetical protein